MIISHQDGDHSGGARSLLQTVPVDWVASSLPADNTIVIQRPTDGSTTLRCVAGQHWEWDGVRFAILHPPASHYEDPKLKTNDLSCVVRVDSAFGSALLTGDIEAKSEALLLQRDPSALEVDVLVVPHHGSKTSSTSAFIAAVSPAFAVFTPGYRNRFGHPRPEIVARYADAGIANYRTDFDGALIFDFAPAASLLPRAQRDHDRRYWREAPQRDDRPLD